jgi:hypothetical protein
MSEATVENFSATAEMPVKEWLDLLNVLNNPDKAPVVVLWHFISTIEKQIGPQIEQASAALEAIKAVSTPAEEGPVIDGE